MILPAIASLTFYSLVALLVSGGLFFALGALLGWFLWRGYREQAQKIELKNADIERQVRTLEAELRDLEA